MRQYVGARYTIKIYENSQDPSSAEWEEGGTYEPLTMVTYLNSSYLSKKDVPPTVGNPAANPSYWAITGAYNGQIAALQDQIDDIVNTQIPAVESEIDTLTDVTIPAIEGDVADIKSQVDDLITKKKVLVIGDSYNTVTTDGWDDVFESIMGFTSDQYYNLNGAGYGFYRNGTQTFLSLLQADIDNITDKDKFTDIIVGAGANDSGVTYATLKTAISDFNTYVKAQFPNAILHVAFVSWSVDRSYASSYRAVYHNYKQICYELGISFYEGVEAAMHDATFFNTVDYPDGIHPNQSGNNAIGGAMAQAFKDGIANVNRLQTASFTPNTSTISSSSTYLFNAFITNNMNILELGTLEITLNDAVTAGGSVQIGTYDCDIFKANTAIPVYNLDGTFDYLSLYWDGRASIRFSQSHSANETISYYFAAPVIFQIMKS